MADPNNIQADVPYQTAPAERGKFWPVDNDYLTSIGYPTSGSGKYAILTYSINASSSSGVESSGVIVDGVNNTIKATVVDLVNANPLTTLIVDANGDQITSFGATLIAETGIPVPVADGEPVDLWVNEYGKQVIAGYNQIVDALDVNIVNEAMVSRLGPVLNLDNAPIVSNGATVNVSLYHNYTIHIIASAITIGLTVEVQHSLDGINWASISRSVITEDGVTEVSISQEALLYIRTAITSGTGGTITSYIYAGN